MTTTHTVQADQIYESCTTGARIRVITVHDQPDLWGTATVEPLTGRRTTTRTIHVRRLNPAGARTGWRLITPTGEPS